MICVKTSRCFEVLMIDMNTKIGSIILRSSLSTLIWRMWESVDMLNIRLIGEAFFAWWIKNCKYCRTWPLMKIYLRHWCASFFYSLLSLSSSSSSPPPPQHPLCLSSALETPLLIHLNKCKSSLEELQEDFSLLSKPKKRFQHKVCFIIGRTGFSINWTSN